MNKPKFETPDMTQENIKKIEALFPNCITEAKDENGKLKKVVNFEMLKQVLSDEALEGDESYEFTWVGKKAAIVEANRPIRKTLRPCKEESVNWDSTENLYIEGDNLEVLKLLQESYLGKVKMIYIDPPYNTGHDFVYPDSFIMDNEDYDARTGYFDDDGNVNFSRENSISAGKYHSDWCSMMYSRLSVSRNLLSPDGVIFISIDENEVQNMRKICDEIFGEQNFVSQCGWQKVYSPKNQAHFFSNDYEFVLCYANNGSSFKLNPLPRTAEMNSRYKNPDNDPRGDWKPGDCVGSGERKNGYYDVISPTTGKVFNVPKGKHWVYAPETMKHLLETNQIYFGKDGNAFPAVKQYLSEVSGRKASSLFLYEDYGHTDMAKKEVISLFSEFEQVPFDTPKPTKMMKMLSILGSNKDSIILDFFSGSASLADGIMQLNAEDNGNRKFIMVQLPEPADSDADYYKAGLTNLCEIGKERIRRAGKKIKEENPLTTQDLDIGFRVLKVDDSNMKDVYYSAAEYEQRKLDMFESNIKEDRNDLDLLFGCLLDWGLPLSLPYTSETIGKFSVNTYNDGDLVACFNEDVSEEVVKEIARTKPLRAVFRDSSFSNSASKINVFEIFKMISPETSVKVI